MKKLLMLSILLLASLSTTTFASQLPLSPKTEKSDSDTKKSKLDSDKTDSSAPRAFHHPSSPNHSPQRDAKKESPKIESPSAQHRRIAQVIVVKQVGDSGSTTVVAEEKGLEIISRGSLTPPIIHRSHHDHRTLSAAFADIDAKTANSSSAISSSPATSDRSSSGIQSPVLTAISPMMTPVSTTSRVQSPSSTSPEEDDSKNPKRVVICVDDEKINRMVVQKQIGSINKKWEVIFATCGSEAIKIIYTRLKNNLPIDVILMDFNMLALNGAQTTAIIRSLTTSTPAQLPIIGFTTEPAKKTWDACLSAGMNKVVKKPAKKDLLEAELKTAFQTRDEAILAQIKATNQPVEYLAEQGNDVEYLLGTLEKIDHKESTGNDSESIAPRAANISYLVDVSDPSTTESKTSVATDVRAMIKAYLKEDNKKQ